MIKLMPIRAYRLGLKGESLFDEKIKLMVISYKKITWTSIIYKVYEI